MSSIKASIQASTITQNPPISTIFYSRLQQSHNHPHYQEVKYIKSQPPHMMAQTPTPLLDTKIIQTPR